MKRANMSASATSCPPDEGTDHPPADLSATCQGLSVTLPPTRLLARFASTLVLEFLPPDVVDRTKYFLLDYVAVASRGSRETSSQVIHRVLEDIDSVGRGEVIIGTDLRAAFPYSALANGTSGHALELDDVHNSSSLHPGTVVIPAALATAEHTCQPGRAFIEGVVVGYEIMARLGMALDPAKHYRQGFHPTGTCGVFGAAAAAARILALDEDQTANALGLAGSMAAGSLEFLSDGAWSKRVHAGWAAYGGVMASLMAKKGMTGPTTIIEGPFGFLHAYSESAKVARTVESLGEAFEISNCSIKPYACCRYMQAPLDGLLSIVAKHHIRAEDVDEVTLGILDAGFPVVAEPRERKLDPKTLTEAQLSMPFGAAIALIHGRFTFEELTESNLASSRVRALMKRIVCVRDPELDIQYPQQWPATVQIKTKDNRLFSTHVPYPRGDPDNPLTWDELEKKAKGLMAGVFSSARSRQIVEVTRRLESISDIRQYSSLLLRSTQ